MEGEPSDINPLLKCDRSQCIIYTYLQQNQFYLFPINKINETSAKKRNANFNLSNSELILIRI